jgi:formylglycine-generating enzyme required for sulfatase activity
MIATGGVMMGDDEESPLQEVYVSGFYIDKYEVTVARYAKFLKTTGGVRPPEHWHEANLRYRRRAAVDWQDADAYCRWAAKLLPTEAEWERRHGGLDGRKYPWGNDEPTSVRANFGKRHSVLIREGFVPVGGRDIGTSPYGAHDLAGNASEWVADWFADGFACGEVRNPKGPKDGIGKVIRGGGCYDAPDRLKIDPTHVREPRESRR